MQFNKYLPSSPSTPNFHFWEKQIAFWHPRLWLHCLRGIYSAAGFLQLVYQNLPEKDNTQRSKKLQSHNKANVFILMWLKWKCRLRKLSKFTLRGRVAGYLRDGLNSSISRSLASPDCSMICSNQHFKLCKTKFPKICREADVCRTKAKPNLIQVRKNKAVSQPNRRLKLTSEKDVSFFSTAAFCNSSTRFCNIFILFSFSFSCSSLEFISA